MPLPRTVVETGPERVEFAREVARFVARLSEDGPLGVSLSLPFGLSASMKRHGMGLDAVSEPVPLRLPDRVMFVLNLAVYLDGLLSRAARVLGVSRGEAADAAVELLRSN